MRHGGDLAHAINSYGIAADGWLDLSTGINPEPYPVRQSDQENRLPAPRGLERLLCAARSAYNVPQDLAICAAPGTEILIRILPWLMPGETALRPTTYRSYAEAWAAARQVIDVLPDYDSDDPPGNRNLVLVNPNNPDGRWTAPNELLAIARTRNNSARLVVDEAFADADGKHSLVPFLKAENRVVVLKSFGKFFGLPGIRLGFAIGTPALIEPIAALLGDWPVSTRALEVGLDALSDSDWQMQTRRTLAEQTNDFDLVLRAAGFEVIGGTALFRLVRHNAPKVLQDQLAKAGIWVRIFDEAPEWVRIGLPGSSGIDRLRAALAELPA